MNLKHYTTPAIVAAAAHAALFLFEPENPTTLSDSGRRVLAVYLPPLPTEPIPRPEPPETKSEFAPVKSLKGEEVPSIPDIIRSNGPKELVIPAIDGTTKPAKDLVKIGGPPGDPNGDPNGELRFVGPTVITSGMLDNDPRYRARPAPDYPFSARQGGLEGEVVVEFDVDATGRVAAARVLRSTDRLFEEPAMRAVLKWRFEPGKKNGRAVAFRMAVPIVFSLENS